MAENELAGFETLLRQRHAALWADIQRELVKHEGQQFSDFIQDGGADPGDLSLADLLVDLNLAEIDRDVEDLRAVEHALGRIRRGTYGICASCGQPINIDRLRALPEAALCFECQSREERYTETPSL